MPGYLDALSTYRSEGFAPTGFFPIPRLGHSLVLGEFDCVLARDLRSCAARGISLLPALDGNAGPAPRVSVVVTACADSAALRICLGRIRTQADALGAELLLVVNAPESALGDARDEIAKLCDRVLFEPRVGKSNALNAAVAVCRGQVIAFSDDDAEPQAGWLAALVAPLLAPERPVDLVGVGGPVYPLFPERGVARWFREIVESKNTYFLGPRHDLGAEPIDYSLDHRARTGVPIGANCAYRREVFAFYQYDPRLGPNRETGLRGGEDSLLGMALMLDGFRLAYVPEARVAHPVHADRTHLEHVRRGYFIQGVEFVRIRNLLGVTLPPPAFFRRKLRGVRAKMWVARVQVALRRTARRERRWLNRLFKYQRMRGILAEMRAPFARW
jgi:glycosyltransferase involved in cell wall biosynthesis